MLRNLAALFRTPASRTVALIFALNSVLFGNWFARIPAVQGDLGLSEGDLGLALLGLPLGSVIGLPLAGGLVARFGAGRVTWWSAIAFSLALPLPALAGGALGLALGLAVLGLATGILDVAMNAEAAAIEARSDLSLMSSFHAMYSLGGILGAATGGLAAAAGLAAGPHLIGFALAAVLVVYLRRGTMSAGPAAVAADSPAAPLVALPRGPLIGLALVGCATMLGEGAAADWSAVYLASGLGAGQAVAALGFAAFSGGMTVGRLYGDGLRDRYGEVAVVRGGALIAAAGLGLGLFLAQPWAAVVGFACLGLGFAGIVPILFRRAAAAPGFAPGVGLAAVAAVGYAGFLAGPPFIGLAAEYVGLGPALTVVPALALLNALAAGPVLRAVTAGPTPAADARAAQPLTTP